MPLPGPATVYAACATPEAMPGNHQMLLQSTSQWALTVSSSACTTSLKYGDMGLVPRAS